jgi:hypothetical protein
MNCVFCGDNSGIDLPEYKKVCQSIRKFVIYVMKN